LREETIVPLLNPKQSCLICLWYLFILIGPEWFKAGF
jgi:hypothetical protein